MPGERDDRDDEDDRPRRRRRDEDDDEDDRPRRRRRDEDDDEDDRPRRARNRGKQLGPLDATFRDTNIAVLILFALCCRGIAFILALVCFLTAKDEKAKSNATIVMIIDAVLFVVFLLVRVLGVFGQAAGGR